MNAGPAGGTDMGLRKNYRNLTGAERDRFVRALYHVKKSGLIDQFARMHERHFFHGIHRSSHFPPWHREMLLRFERKLQEFHPDVTVPYWDSTVDRSPSDPLWDKNFLGQFDSEWNLKRAFGAASGSSLPTQQQVQANQGRSSYDSFWRELEDPIHNMPHRWVGGVMGDVASPGDPVFYLHHCWIDMLWARWQRAHPGTPFVSSGAGAGLNDPLMEWPDRTPADVLDHVALGYAYDTDPVVTTGPTAQGNDMQPGEVLNPDQAISSANGLYTFIYQGDGNLVLYRAGGVPLWASGTDGKAVGACIMQGDGNLVIYGPGGLYVWDSATDGNANSSLIVQDDGNVVIYRPDGAPVWDTGTWAPTGPVAQGDDMQPGEVLNADQAVTSADGRYTFVYQGDGNLVLYRNIDGRPLWASGTDGRPVGVCIMQGDGNLVIYGPGGEYVWDTSTHDNPGSRLVTQGDGNVVIYRPDGTPVWDTGTWVPTGPSAQGDDMQPGEVLDPGQSITSADGHYVFVYQGDGNLVLYHHAMPLWASGTDGRSVGVCIMQGDGNLVIYGPGGEYIWDSATDGNPGSGLVVQGDGNVVIYRPNGTPIWATNTAQP